jgi:crotonobetainyl-CoA:carnitine CoA-transferase CaiB-like acyl-CoA transferase
MVEDVVHSSLGPMKVLGSAVRINGGDPDWLRLAPPRLGEHSRELLLEAGLDAEEVDRLVSSGVAVEPSEGLGQWLSAPATSIGRG